MTRRSRLCLIGLAIVGTACGQRGPESVAAREAAYRENNRGVAALEQYAYDEAAARFRAAIALDGRVDLAHVNLPIALYYLPDLDAAAAAAAEAVRRVPDSPHAVFAQGLIARARNELAAAIASFERVLALDPEDVGALVNLAQIDLQERRLERAVQRFRAAVAREPFNATATYGLGQALIRSGLATEGAEIMTRFEELRATGAAITYSQGYLEQGQYAEAIVSTGLEPELIDPVTPPVRFVDQTSPWGAAASSSGSGSASAAAVALTDLDADGAIELVVAEEAGVRISSWTGTRFQDRTAAGGASAGLGGVTGLIAADLDNDTRPDLLVVLARGLAVLLQNDSGGFRALATRALPARLGTAALLDVDHDGDLDVLAGGAGDSRQAPGLTLLQNDGQATLRDITATAGFESDGTVIAFAPTDFDGGRDIDVYVVFDDRAPALFANQRDGTFRNVSAETGLAAMPPGVALAAGDFNKDGRTDFFVVHRDAPATVALSRGGRQFFLRPAPEGTRSLTAAQAADYDNDGLLDVIGVGPRGLHVFRNIGADFVDVTAEAVEPGVDSAFGSFALGDVDRDGDLDIAAVAPGGAVRLFRNDGGSANRSLAITLRGLVSNRSGVGARVDVRAGSLWQRLEHTAVTPAVAPFEPFIGRGARETVDVVRVLWPAGIVQAETLAAEDRASQRHITITELDRKPSSCPYLYTWNGQGFEFVSDFLGGGEMGYWTGAGGWNTPDSDEYVRITDAQLTARDGRLGVRVTNELEEVLYLDEVRLLSVDHPSDVQVYPREGMRAAPARGLSLAAVRNVRPLPRVVSDRGVDVTARLARRDGLSAHAFVERPLRGYAEPHALVLTLPPLSSGVRSRALLLTGWTDYAFSSDNVAAAQRGWTLDPPRLERRTADGAWRPLIVDVGVPVGRPQTIVVDIGGAAPEGGMLRLATSMRIHWDRVAIADLASDVTLVPREHQRERATLGWRGYSAERMQGAARVPDYSQVTGTAPWKVFPGRYTREGDVGSLLAAPDDLFVVARTGDEIALSFIDHARAPGAGARTFLLHAVGFSKEMDINSSSPDHVLPLPYRGITAYPPPRPAASLQRRQQELIDRYNTRVVARPMSAVPVSR